MKRYRISSEEMKHKKWKFKNWKVQELKWKIHRTGLEQIESGKRKLDELEDKSIEIMQSEKKSEKTWNKNERGSKDIRTILKGLTCISGVS